MGKTSREKKREREGYPSWGGGKLPSGAEGDGRPCED